MDLSIAGEQTDGGLPTHRTLSRRALWWMSALLLAGMIAIVLPIQKIRLLGAQLGGTIGSYTTSPPPAPQYAAISPGGSSITVYWSQVPAATSYSVYRSDKTYNGQPFPIGSGNSTSSGSYTDQSATSGGPYTYWVTASNGGAESGGSPSVSATVNTPTPSAPAHGKLTVSGGSIKAYFSTVTGASSYNAYRDGWLMQTGVTSPYTDGGVPAGTSHSYTFAAVNSNGQGGMGPYYLSGTGGATPPVTTNLAATAGASSVQLSWNAVTDATGGSISYNLYRSSSAGGEGDIPVQNWISSNGSGSVSYTDNDVSLGVTYYYKVAAVSNMGGGEGTLSNEASATPATQLLPAPQLSAAAGDSSASLSWTAVAGATSYNVYRSYYNDPVGKGSVPLVKVGASGTTYTDSGLTNGSSGYYTWYYYTVYAVSKDGQGTSSQSVSVDPGSPAPTLKSHALWTSDYTVTPNVQTGSDSGMVAGDKSVHLSVLVPPNITSAVANSVTIHEDAGDTQDVTGTNVSLTVVNPGSNTSGWSAVCGDPNPLDANAPTMAYCDVPWSDAGTHDGNYTITVSCQATVGGSATPVALTATNHVDNEDVLIKSTDPAHPAPVVWNPPPPDPNNPNAPPPPVPVRVTISAADKRNRRITLSIYNRQHISPLLQGPPDPPIRILTIDGSLGGNGDEQKTFYWQGQKADGRLVAPGVLFYKFEVAPLDQSGNALAVADTEQSLFLDVSFSSSAPQVTDVSDQTVTLQIDYTLSDFSVATGNSAASTVKIDLYGPDFKVRTVNSANLTPVVGSRKVTLSVDRAQFDKKGTYTFVLSATDVHPDKGHRSRWALSNSCTIGLDKQVLLTFPDNMVFRGRSTKGAPCPVMITGQAPFTNAVLTFTYEKQRMAQNAQGVVQLDANGKPLWETVQPETDVSMSQLVNPQIDPITFNFTVTWNQQLDRTQIGKTKNDSTVLPTDDLTHTGREAWAVRAYTFINPNPPASNNPDLIRRFRVFSMAHPVAAPAMPNNGFTKFRPGGMVSTFALTSNKVALTILSFNPGGPHLAIDYGYENDAGAKTMPGSEIRSTEAGTLNDVMLMPLDRAIPETLTDSIVQAMIDSRIPGDQLRCVATQAVYAGSDTNILGVNRVVSHGLINLALITDAMGNGHYDQGTLTTKYCHLQALPGDPSTPLNPVTNPNLTGKNDKVDISTPIGKVGDYYVANTAETMPNLQNQFSAHPGWLLSRGYYTLDGVVLHVYRLADVNMTTGQITKGATEFFTQRDPVTIAFPSVDGPHLHFEVRIPEKKVVPTAPNGEDDPDNWIGLPFGSQ